MPGGGGAATTRPYRGIPGGGRDALRRRQGQRTPRRLPAAARRHGARPGVQGSQRYRRRLHPRHRLPHQTHHRQGSCAGGRCGGEDCGGVTQGFALFY